MARRDELLRMAQRIKFVHFDGLSGAMVYLPEGYPALLPTQAAFSGCPMPNPDIGPLIKQWRPRHVAKPSTQTILNLRDAIWSQRKPSPRGGDIILLGAGPSLAEHLIDIRRMQPYATIVALNRAVIGYPHPDIFFCLERQSKEEWWRGTDYCDPVDPRTATVVCPSTHADVVDYFPPSSRWYCVTPWCGFDRWEDAPQWALNLPAIPTCETTLSACLSFCCLLEPRRIILVGCDHAWKLQADETGNMAEFRDYYVDGEPWPAALPPIAGVEGINGRLCAISPFSQRHAEVTVACCQQIHKMTGIEVINASGHGIVNHNVQNSFFFNEIQGRKQKGEKEKQEALTRRFDYAASAPAVAPENVDTPEVDSTNHTGRKPVRAGRRKQAVVAEPDRNLV